MSADLQALIPPLQPYAQALINLAGRAGVQPRVTSTLRTRSEQKRLYNQFLRGETKYPVAPPGTSAHEFGYAFDMVADTAENLHDLGSVWQQWGGLWHPSDEVHFEFPGFNANAAVPVNLPSSNTSLKVCDFLVGLGDLGILQLADTVAEMVAPLHCDDPSYGDTDRLECQVQRLIQGPCSSIVRAALGR